MHLYPNKLNLITYFISEWVAGSQGFGAGSFAALLIGCVLSIAVLLLLITLCALRKKTYDLRNSSATPTKQIEITQGDDQRYVVSYQLKSETKQPDILNRGKFSKLVIIIFVNIFCFEHSSNLLYDRILPGTLAPCNQ